MRRVPFRSDESGVATVMFVLCMPFVLLVMIFAVDVANWFVHKRHLQNQADAAALAGAGAYTFPNCNNTAIRNTALRYSGKGDSVATVQLADRHPHAAGRTARGDQQEELLPSVDARRRRPAGRAV